MPEITRLIGDCDWIELEFLEREATPEPAMKLGIRLHLAGLSLSDTVSILDTLGVDRHRTTVHTWVKKADLQPTGGACPDHVAVDETVIQLDDQRYWLYAAVDPDTNRILHCRLFPTRNQAVSGMFLTELREKHHVDDAVFLVDSAPWLHAALSVSEAHDVDRGGSHRAFNGLRAVENITGPPLVVSTEFHRLSSLASTGADQAPPQP